MNKAGTIVAATRKSKLALAQTERVRELFATHRPALLWQALPMSTSGDQRQDWSLIQHGGKGLFVKELEAAMLEGRADIAVHSAKDMPTTLPEGLVLAGYLPREDARDMLLLREGVERPASIATSSPRRRLQAARLFPDAQFREIRGNVETRLRKVVEGEADALILAVAGLKRLGIHAWPGLTFQPLSLDEMVPAPGQAAIAVECRAADLDDLRPLFHSPTGVAVEVERALLHRWGGGCQSAFAAHFDGTVLRLFDEKHGLRKLDLSGLTAAGLMAAVESIPLGT